MYLDYITLLYFSNRLWAQLHAKYFFVKHSLNMSTENKNVSRDTAHIPKFDGSNFNTWKFCLMLQLRNNQLQQIALDVEKLPAEVMTTRTQLLFLI